MDTAVFSLFIIFIFIVLNIGGWLRLRYFNMFSVKWTIITLTVCDLILITCLISYIMKG
jgi:hypothetical protein